MGRRPRHHPKFDAQTILGVYRWERLRLDPAYQALFEWWKWAPGVSIVSSGVPVFDPFDPELKNRYTAQRRQYGLRQLVNPAQRISLEAMADYPLFSDTPRRQPELMDKKHKEEEWRRQVDRLAAQSCATPQGGTCIVLSVPNLDRLRHRHFRYKTVAAGPFQIALPVRRVHLGVLETGLEVFWRTEEGLSARAIARKLSLTRDQVVTALRVAQLCILGGAESLQAHWQTCRSGCGQGRIERCDWMQRYGPPDLRDRRWFREPATVSRPRRRAGGQQESLDRLPDPQGPTLPARSVGRRPPR